MRLSHPLFLPVENGFLALTRIALGFVVLVRLGWYLASNDISYLSRTQIMFDFPGFGWLPEIPGAYIEPLYMGLIPLALLFTAGIAYRFSTIVLCLGWSYGFFLDLATWGNLDYLICWMLLLFAFLPADSRLGGGSPRRNCPTIVLWALRVLVFVVYFFAGVIKLDARWLSGDVVAYFVTIENQNPTLASLFAVPWVPPAFAVGGMLFDLFIVPALLLAPTRKLAVGALVFFHAFNYAFIGLGTIPWVMLVLTLLVCLPPATTEAWCRSLESMLGRATPDIDGEGVTSPGLWTAVFVAFTAVHLLLPMRHHFCDGDAKWNLHGHVYSWWLRTVHSDVHAKFYATWDGQSEPVKIQPLDYIEPEQSAMAVDPMMLAQFARHVADKMRKNGKTGVQIRPDVTKAVNFGPRFRFLPRDLDLASVPADADPNSFILQPGQEVIDARD